MIKLSFYGAAQEVTGSCYLIESDSHKILIDCGMFQSPRFSDNRNNNSFPFDPKNIEALFVTHAHVDHTGRIPKLIKGGFSGKIYSTLPTMELAELMLKDSVGVLMKEAEREGEPILYTEDDVGKAMRIWEGRKYHEEIVVGDFRVSFFDAGHILGSSMAMVTYKDGEVEKKILFSGDLGNPNNPLMAGTEKTQAPDFLVVEATYGDREHEGASEKRIKLERVIEKSVLQGGVLMIPAFSLERTQELLLEISDMLKNKQIPNVPIFLDSPLAIHATEIYQKYYNYLNNKYVNKESFSFFKLPSVHFCLTTDESKKINDTSSPKVIIAGSGMSTGGRILHHERRYLRDPKSTILFIGYQAPGSLGRRIEDGASIVKIFGEDVYISCHRESIYGYSAHPDENSLFEFIRGKADGVKKVFVTHAEPKSGLAMVQKIRDYIGIDATAPKYGDSVII